MTTAIYAGTELDDGNIVDVRGRYLICLLASGCSQLLGLHDPPGEPDAAVDAVQQRDAATDAGPRCGVSTTIADPTFADPTAWTASGGAVVDGTAMGVDLGVGSIDNLDGTLAQSLCVAGPPSGQGLALAVAVGSNGTGGGGQKDRIARVRVGPQQRDDNDPSITFATFSMCIGDLAYDADVTLELSGAQLNSGESIRYDQVSIAPVAATTCPVPGTVRGGDFEDVSAWTSSYFIEGGAGARRAHLRTGSTSPYTCNSAYMGGIASVPATLANAALSFQLHGGLPANSTFYLDLNAAGLYARAFSAAGLPSAPTVQTVCVPASMRGHVIDLGFGMFQIPADPCPSAMNAYIDTITVTSSSMCAP